MPSPTLTEFRKLYEVLVRLDGDTIKGAHVKYLEGVTKDGVTIQASEGPAIPLSLADAADISTLKNVLGDAAYAMLTAKEAAEADANAARSEFEAKDATAQTLLTRISELEAEVQAAKDTEVGKLQAEMAAKDATNQALLARIAELEGKPGA